MNLFFAYLIGVARQMPDVCTFVTPVFRLLWNGQAVRQQVNEECRIVGFTPIAMGEEFVPTKSEILISSGDEAVLGFEAEPGRFTVGTAPRLCKHLEMLQRNPPPSARIGELTWAAVARLRERAGVTTGNDTLITLSAPEKTTEKNPVVSGFAVARNLVNLSKGLPESDDLAGRIARSLFNLSQDPANPGDRRGGLAAIHRAADIYEAPAHENFAVYAPDLAGNLNNLSVHLANRGDHAGGLAAIRRALDIYEALAHENFTVYAADLARSLNNLFVHLANCGDHAGGLAAIRRALDIYEALAHENFAVYAADLARSRYVLSLQLTSEADRTKLRSFLSMARVDPPLRAPKVDFSTPTDR